jgi:hypothetical protein
MADHDSTAQPASRNAPALGLSIEAPRVLLVIADESERSYTANVMARGGINVVSTVPNYAQAIVAVRDTGGPYRLDAIVTELHAGQVMTPAGYIQALHRFDKVPVILYTTDELAEGQAETWGARDALRKPDGVWSLADAVLVATGRMPAPKPEPAPKT